MTTRTLTDTASITQDLSVPNQIGLNVAVATSSNIGAVKSGPGLSIAGDGTLSSSYVIDVTKFGATGNGSTDDTAAIQAAINSINPNAGAKIYFPTPSAYYLISSTLTVISDNVELTGQTTGATIVANTGFGANPMIRFKKNDNDQILFSGMSNLKLYLFDDAASGVEFVAANQPFINKCWIESTGPSSTGTGIYSTDNNTWGGGLRLFESYVNLFFTGLLFDGAVTAAAIIGSWIHGNTKASQPGCTGIKFINGSGDGSTITCCDIEDWDVGIYDAGGGFNSITANRFENHNCTWDIQLTVRNNRNFIVANTFNAGQALISYPASAEMMIAEQGILYLSERPDNALGVVDPIITLKGGDNAASYGPTVQFINSYDTDDPISSIKQGNGTTPNPFGETTNNPEFIHSAQCDIKIGTTGNDPVTLYSNSIPTVTLTNGSATIANAVTAPSYKIGSNTVLAGQAAGYGTPTGGSHQASFAAGSITLANLAACVAQLIIDLKAGNMPAT